MTTQHTEVEQTEQLSEQVEKLEQEPVEQVVAGEAKKEEAQENQPEVVTKAEYDRLRAENERIKQTQSGYDKIIDRLGKGIDNIQGQVNAIQNKASDEKLNLMARSQAGELDESKGTLTQQISRVDAAAKTQQDNLVEQQRVSNYAEQTAETLRTILRAGGIDPEDGGNPIVKGIQDEWKSAVSQGTPLTNAFQMAAQAVAQKATPVTDKDAAKDALEAAKRSPAMKVPASKPSGSVLRDEDFIVEFSKGALSTDADFKRANEILTKLKHGG